MSSKELVLLIAACVSLGFIFGFIFRMLISLARKNSLELELRKMHVAAEEKAQNIVLQAEEKASSVLESAREQTIKRESDLRTQLDRANLKEHAVDKRTKELDQETQQVRKKIEDVRLIKNEIEEKKAEYNKKIQQIAHLDTDEARKQVIKSIEQDEAEALLSRMRKLELYAEEQLAEKAKSILASTIQRLASNVNSDILTTHIPIENSDIKGKVIGKEGRNIKVFERETGVEVLVDESPDSITLSSFDPIRRFIAKTALEELIKDGRIQPAKIEKAVSDAKAHANKVIKEVGEKAVFEAGIPNLDPRIVVLLGRLHFRTSYGQNVLQHSLECAHLAGMLAEEIGANVRIAKAGALLHDIGKALDHEVSGTHVEIGRQVLQKFGVEENIIKAMQAHHEEYPYETIESRIVQTADAISGARPGARNNSLEFYLKRLEDLENIASRHAGVEKAYALQAGREIRIFINAEKVSDFEAKNIAKNIASQIEKELKYPGEIKVTVIRETRIIETAR